MAVAFRNVDASPEAPVAQWPYEGLVAAIERGTVTDWARISRELRLDPWGPVARQVELYLSYSQPWGVGPLLARAVLAARQHAVEQERAAVAAEVRELIKASGLSMAEFASRIGTSRSRLSTYRSGRVSPAATLLVRMRAAAERARATRPPD